MGQGVGAEEGVAEQEGAKARPQHQPYRLRPPPPLLLLQLLEQAWAVVLGQGQEQGQREEEGDWT